MGGWGGATRWRGARTNRPSHPPELVAERAAIGVGDGAGKDQNDINELPDSAAAARDEHQDSQADVSGVEPMDAVESDQGEEQAEQPGHQAGFFAYMGGCVGGVSEPKGLSGPVAASSGNISVAHIHFSSYSAAIWQCAWMRPS